MMYSTPLMIAVALIPMRAHGDLGPNIRSTSKFNRLFPSVSVTNHGARHIMKDVPSKPINHSSQAGAHSRGWVEMGAKIDMRAIIELLDNIPEILHILRNMSNRADNHEAESFFGPIVSHIAGLKDAVGSGFYDVNKRVHDLSQELHERPLDETLKQVIHLLEFLESNAQKPVHCELTEVEHGIQSMGRIIENLLKQLLHDVSAEKSKGDQGLAGIRDNGKLLLKIVSLLDGVYKNSGNGFGLGDCQVCLALQDMHKLGKDQTNLLHGLASTAQGITKDIAAVFKADGGLGGLRKDIQTLLRFDEGIKGTLARLTQAIEALNAKSDKFFSQNLKVIFETQYAVAETAKTIKKTASTAELAVKKIVKEASRASRAANSKVCP